jgi:hypothetical protein
MVLPTQKLMKSFLEDRQLRALSLERQQNLRANEGVCLTSSLTLAIDFLDDGRIQC